MSDALAEWAQARGLTLSPCPGLQPSITDPEPECSTKRFTLHVFGDIDLSADDIWPDGKGPTHPTTADVISLIHADGIGRVIRDWNLEGELDCDVSEIKPR